MTSLFHAKLVLPKFLCLQANEAVAPGKTSIALCPTFRYC